MRDRCIVALLGGGFDDASLLVGLYRRSRIGAAPTRLGQLRMLVTKPFEYGRKVAGFVRANGTAIRAQYGVSPVRQFLALYAGWLEGTARPCQLAAYWAFNVHRPRKWGAWITGVQANVLLGGLAERRAPELARLIGDKRYFAAWGAERGLPTLPVLATFESGAPVGRSADEVAEGLPAIDLFAKPADLWSGQGTRRWRVAAGSPQRWLDEQGQEIGAPEIVSALAAQSLERPLVLQRCLHTHPDMVLLAPDAVSTVRCVTCEDLDGVPRLLGAGIRIPMPGMIVDNMNAGGMVASIDMETGRLSQGIVRRENGMLERSSTLRGSATQLEGQEIALWPEVRRIALEAQRAAGLPFVGWDIALCAGGPILLEANIRWGGALLTFGSLSPLTDTDFPAVYMHHWARGPGARGPGQEP